jgi:hypothetical protein
MGIDRDLDTVLDADVPSPSLQIARTAASTVINWPYSAAGFNLESATALVPSAWSNVMDPVEVITNRNYVTNSSPSTVQFFRLRLP